MDLCAWLISCCRLVSSLSRCMYQVAMAMRICSTVTCSSEAPKLIATSLTCIASSSGTGRESFSVSSSSFKSCTDGSGPSPMQYRVRLTPTDFGI